MKPVRTWIGFVLVSLGLLGILDAAGVSDAGELLSSWWPVAVIGLGVAAVLSQRHLSLGPGVIVAIGLVMLVDEQEWTTGDVLWPALFVAVGVAVLAGLRRHRTIAHEETGAPVALFGGTKVRNRAEHLTHSSVSAVFGGATLDLREAHIDQEADVDAFALFGGVDVLVPRGWRVSLGGLPIFGGYDDNTEHNGTLPPDAPVLRVNATALFGGVDVRNEPK
ncbi:LiaF domain-containing protein [Actinosynnema sp. NPDC051121]